MNTDQTKSKMKFLRLHGMLQRYESIIDCMRTDDLPDFHTGVGMLIEAQYDDKIQSSIANALKQSKLRYKIDPQDIECSRQRGLSKEQWIQICEGNFINDGTNIIILGATGVGKSAIACALGKQMCRIGKKVLYYNGSKFNEEIKASKLNGSYMKFLNRVSKVPVLILDDFGLKPLDEFARTALFDILEDRSGNGSVIIASQLPISNWYDRFGDRTLAEACMDRMTGNAIKIQLTGESRRTRQK